MPVDIQVLASGSSGNCYRISDGYTNILLDAGIPIRRIRAGCGFGLRDIAACLVTHSHGDHCKAVDDLLRAAVTVYMPPGEISAAGIAPHHRLRPLRAENDLYQPISARSFVIQPFRVEHDTPEPVGYLLASSKTGERLLYFTDTFFVRNRFSGLTHIIGEVNYNRDVLWQHVTDGQTPAVRAKRLFASHMSLDTFLDFLRSNDISKLQQIYVCHMSDDHGDAAATRETIQRLTGAEVYIC